MTTTNPMLVVFNEITDETMLYGLEYELTFAQSYNGGFDDDVKASLIAFIRDVASTHFTEFGKWQSYIVYQMLCTYMWARHAGYVQSQEDMHVASWYKKAIHAVKPHRERRTGRGRVAIA